MLETIKKTWLYAIAITAITVSAITYGVIKTIISPLKDENKRLDDKLNNAKQEIISLKSTLSLAKDQYDIPDSTIEDFAQQKYESDIKSLDYENLNIIKSPDLVKPVITVIERNQTTQVLFKKFPITISTANVEPDGKTKFNVGYVLPNKEIPESLQFDLYPSQATTVISDKGVELFYVEFLASNPRKKMRSLKS